MIIEGYANIYQEKSQHPFEFSIFIYGSKRLGEFINELCNDFGWEPLFDYNQSEVEDMIKGILK